jgi:reverse gyrase
LVRMIFLGFLKSKCALSNLAVINKRIQKQNSKNLLNALSKSHYDVSVIMINYDQKVAVPFEDNRFNLIFSLLSNFVIKLWY